MRWLWLVALAGCTFDGSSGTTQSTTSDASPMMADAPVTVDAQQHPADASPQTPDARSPDAGLPDASCPSGCMTGMDPCCPTDCAAGQSCGAGAGGMHYFRCTGNSCNVVCSGNSSCSVDCGGATGQCALSCSGSQASCMVQCNGATDCPLSCNPQAVMLCGSDVKVCGRPCP